MRTLQLGACLVCLLWLWVLPACAGYVGTSPLLIQESNISGQNLGTQVLGQPTIPLQTQNNPPFSLFPSQSQVLSKWAIYPDVQGREAAEITDGVSVAALAPPRRGASPAAPGLVVAISPNPSLQCPFVAPINQTASTTVIAAQDSGKSIHICSGMVVSASQQGISLAEGTGTTCGTNTTYLMGGSGGTAQVANGFNIGGSTINLPMQKVGDNICVLQSAAFNVSGYLTYGVY